MARRVSASCRLCRREGEKLFLKGTKCFSDKCAIMRRSFAPGMHGMRRSRKPSNYAIQLREKQKAKRIYGILEKQFRNYFKKAEKAKGATGEILLQFLERRLDNVLVRANFAASRAQGRQMARHNFIKINGDKVNIPSYLVKEGDQIEISASDTQKKDITERIKILEDRGRMTADWMQVSNEKLSINIMRLPTKADLGMEIEESLIVELYSK
jgi:small subunit ribosomal protein S4